jgi:hypothetical protein
LTGVAAILAPLAARHAAVMERFKQTDREPGGMDELVKAGWR